MNKRGPIVIIEDDADDRLILSIIFNELGYDNAVAFFEDGQKAIEYLTGDEVMPFLIISDINLPKLNGFEVRDIIHGNEKLRNKSIPFIFFTTASNKQMVREAYAKPVQGFFIKPDTMECLKSSIRSIVDYWSMGLTPCKF